MHPIRPRPLPPSTSPSLALVLTLLVAGCGGPGDDRMASDASADAPGSGPLVIVGGSLDADNAEIHHAVLEGRDGDGPLCVLPTASGVPRESMERAVDRFAGYAADARYPEGSGRVEGIWITTGNPEAAADPAVADRIRGCSGYWFVGGAQSRIVRTFRPASGDTPAYRALMERWREGALVAGSSAGAAMMSTRSIGGGSPSEALEHGVAEDADGDGESDGDGVWVLPGMDLVPWAVVGQHHLARGRWGRLVVAVLEGDDDLGVGIDENTALVLRGGTAEVMGASGVLLVDVSGAVRGDGPRTARGIRLELLGPGDRLDVSTGAVTREAGRSPPPAPRPGSVAQGAGEEAEPVPTLEEIAAAPFERWAFLHLLHAFASGEVEEITLDGGARHLILRRADGFVGLADPEPGTLNEAGTPTGLSVGPLTLELVPPAS